MQGVMCSKTFLWNNNLISICYFFILQVTGCWFYHMTCRHFFIYLWAMKKNNSCNFLNVGCTTWLEDIYSYIYEQWNTFFPLANFWMLVVPHDLHKFSFIYMQWNIFFLALFWRLVVPHDFKTFIHIFMSSETHFPLHISEYWLYHMTYRYFSFIYKQ